MRMDSASGRPTANPWQCPVFPLDVNHDGRITPLDALIVINFLNANGPGTLPVPAIATWRRRPISTAPATGRSRLRTLSW